MSQTFSTLHSEMVGGRLFSTQMPRTVGRVGARQLTRERPTVGSAPEPLRFRFALSSQGLPAASLVGPCASGQVQVSLPAGLVSGSILGLLPLSDPALKPTCWLAHDLQVPVDIAAEDLAALPKGADGKGNRPGRLFTLDGNPPTYGVRANTLAVPITPGEFTLDAAGVWQLKGEINESSNQSFHPLVMLGPAALADSNAPLPSGTVARILTDLFMRPATVHPQLSLQGHFTHRLSRLVADVLDSGAGRLFLDASSYTRAAVTLEGLVRSTPVLMPTKETCILMALERNRE